MSGSIRRTETKALPIHCQHGSLLLYLLCLMGQSPRAPDAGPIRARFLLSFKPAKGHCCALPITSSTVHTHSYLLISLETAGLVGVGEESFPCSKASAV